MVRDRSMECRAAFQESDEDDESLEELVPMEPEMKAFFLQVEKILEVLEKIQRNVADVKTKHSSILSTILRNERTKEQLEQLMFEIKKDSQWVREEMRSMEQSIDQEQQLSKYSVLYRMRKMQSSALSFKFIEVMTEYSRIQTDYRERCKNRIQRQLEITGRAVSNDQLEYMLEHGNLAVFTQGIIMDTVQAKQTLADIEARHADIIKLESSISDLHKMFMDMALLVEAQGDLIDHIEYHVDHAIDFVQTATQDTKKALKYQGKARRKKLFILTCFIILLILIVAYVINYFFY